MCIIVFSMKVIISMYINILIECFKEDFNILPSSQWQCSCSHTSPIFSSSNLFLEVRRITKSIINPAIIPIISLIVSIFNITLNGTTSDINIGSISSDLDRNIAIKVPKVIILPAYKFETIAENPHCGNIPNIPPIAGPNLPDFLIISLDLLLVLCSIYSIIKYAINKNGNNFMPSINVSINTSVIFFLLNL